MRTAAFFDMDKTLLTVNSATKWVQWQVRNKEAPASDLVRLVGWLLQYKFGILDVDTLARKSAAPYKGVNEQGLRNKIAQWIEDEIAQTINPVAVAELNRRREQGHLCVLLTSATEYASLPIAAKVGIDHVLCTRLEVQEGTLTGNFLPPLCYAQGKVVAARKWAEIHQVDLSKSSFYTDSISDRSMLEVVGEPVVVNPDPPLYLLAKRKGWPVHRWIA